jgi:chromosome segregation ATPase
MIVIQPQFSKANFESNQVKIKMEQQLLQTNMFASMFPSLLMTNYAMTNELKQRNDEIARKLDDRKKDLDNREDELDDKEDELEEWEDELEEREEQLVRRETLLKQREEALEQLKQNFATREKINKTLEETYDVRENILDKKETETKKKTFLDHNFKNAKCKRFYFNNGRVIIEKKPFAKILQALFNDVGKEIMMSSTLVKEGQIDKKSYEYYDKVNVSVRRASAPVIIREIIKIIEKNNYKVEFIITLESGEDVSYVV